MVHCMHNCRSVGVKEPLLIHDNIAEWAGRGGGAHVRAIFMTSFTYLWVALRFAANSYFEPQSEHVRVRGRVMGATAELGWLHTTKNTSSVGVEAGKTRA
jgi:hypothetical protein